MSKDYGRQVRLARVYEKTSKTGNTYFTGRIGMAKVAILKSREVAEDGGAIWEILLADGPNAEKRERPIPQADPSNSVSR